MIHRVHRDRDEMGGVCVSALSAGAYTATLYVIVNKMKGGGCASPTLTSLGSFFHNDGMYARKRPLPLCFGSLTYDHYQQFTKSLDQRTNRKKAVRENFSSNLRVTQKHNFISS
jgi:hypothetical protein